MKTVSELTLRQLIKEMKGIYSPSSEWDYDRGALSVVTCFEQCLDKMKKHDTESMTAEHAVFLLGSYLAKMTPEEKKKTVEEWSETYFA